MAGAKRGPKRLEDIRDPVLRRIFEVMPRWGTSQAALCTELQISKENFSRNRVQGLPIDIGILERVAWRSGARVAWLKTGEEPTYEKGELLSALSDDLQDAIQQMRRSPEKAQALLKRAARLLSPGQHDMMKDIEVMMNGMELTNRAWIETLP